jgi:hypothetical protein
MLKMRKFLTILLLLTPLLWAASSDKNDSKRDSRVEKEIQKQIELEKEYSKKNTFYIDLKAAEINKDSLSSVPVIEPDDFDMDHVYD